jgi:hypothetical protein
MKTKEQHCTIVFASAFLKIEHIWLLHNVYINIYAYLVNFLHFAYKKMKFDTVAHIGYMVVHDDTMVCSGIQQYTMVYDGVQWVFGMFPLGRPPDRDFRHIIEFGSPRIDEWMDELHGEEYSSEIDLRLGYHQSRDREKDTHRISLRCYLESLVIPLGLTNTPDTFQSCRQWQWHLVLFSDANSIFNRTWRVHLSQLGEAGRIIAMSEFFHLGYVVRAQRRSRLYWISSQRFQLIEWWMELSTTEVTHM